MGRNYASTECSRYTLLEMVQLRPYSLITYSYVHDAERDYEVGCRRTLKQNIDKEITELEVLDRLEDLSGYASVNDYAKEYNRLYVEKQKITEEKKGIRLKDLGTLSRVQIKNVKRITSLFANATYKNNEKYLAFLTLTLPSKQKHHDRVFRKLLAKFLDHLKKTKGLENYVWKAETQRNGNIHFHLLIDVFIEKDYVQRLWNSYLEKYGYVSAYRAKMCSLSPTDYLGRYRRYYKTDKECLAVYLKQKSKGWAHPSTTKIETPKKASSVYAYLVKYFYKVEENKRPVIGALWGASNKVKKLKYPQLFLQNCHEEVVHLVRKLEVVPVNPFVELFTGEVYALVSKGYKKLNQCIKNTMAGMREYLTVKEGVSLNACIARQYELNLY